MAKKRCLFCREWFRPYAPQAGRQLICGKAKCKRKLKRMLDRAWRRRDPRWREVTQGKRRAWAAARRYWATYRAGKPIYREREKARMKRNRALEKRRKTGTMTAVSRRERG